jgi:hypothetical protein
MMCDRGGEFSRLPQLQMTAVSDSRVGRINAVYQQFMFASGSTRFNTVSISSFLVEGFHQ